MSGLSFREADPNEKSDFNIEFVRGAHGDGSDFDGPGTYYSSGKNQGKISFQFSQASTNKLRTAIKLDISEIRAPFSCFGSQSSVVYGRKH